MDARDQSRSVNIYDYIIENRSMEIKGKIWKAVLANTVLPQYDKHIYARKSRLIKNVSLCACTHQKNTEEE